MNDSNNGPAVILLLQDSGKPTTKEGMLKSENEAYGQLTLLLYQQCLIDARSPAEMTIMLTYDNVILSRKILS